MAALSGERGAPGGLAGSSGCFPKSDLGLVARGWLMIAAGREDTA